MTSQGTTVDQRELDDLASNLQWVHNRRILLVSDSVDRYQSEYVCNRVGEVLVNGKRGKQSTAICHIPLFNLTFINWHVASTSMTRPDWWWVENMDIVPIETRWEKFYLPTLNETIGTNGHSPDLIMIHSSLWDHTFFVNAPQTAGGKVDFSRSLNWREMRFYMMRFKYLVSLLRDLYGADVPMLCRATTYKKSLLSNLSIHDLDRASRYVCHELGIEVMEFGSINQGFFQMYKDMVHVNRGPTSILWANMMFWYLFRVMGGVEVKGELVKMPPEIEVNRSAEWNRCHTSFMNKLYDL
ncbi:hypothetical protein V1512DRAFT_268848 [Lipomyces arxii]|uniref:uncharacterized protein n=1 Tax=Lipomyces arxii TaxID=56418 RepID=UPI0034CFFE62